VKQQKDVKQPLSLSVGLIEKLPRSNVEPIERLWRHNVKLIRKKLKPSGSKSWSFVS